MARMLFTKIRRKSCVNLLPGMLVAGQFTSVINMSECMNGDKGLVTSL